LTVEQARDAAAKHNGKIAEGLNPNDKRRSMRQAPTFKAAFDEFINLPTRTKAKRTKKPKTVKDYRQQFDAYLTAWHNRKLSTVTRPDVEHLHNELAKSSGVYTANRVLSLVKALFNAAIDLEWFAANPAARVPAFEEHSRERFLHADELPKFWAALEAEPSEKIRDFIKLALFTGQRRSAAFQATKAAIDQLSSIPIKRLSYRHERRASESVDEEYLGRTWGRCPRTWRWKNVLHRPTRVTWTRVDGV
jgi:site-specific recombinase XerD